ncbi:gluconokinase [Micromonospora phaseoli]|uniref:Gluconokinase n=1 Tax=Micromonospora phaseoli TaxID=1144548 RepID=A0A1H7DMX4_9ACTN|nr:FGGY family carbohydrate kinase [Micromonospora phaseoli]PZV89427.1 gluconokinase [Micromonospora phaseoli]GIJ80250.1 gluconate kinase [Micromonospora phaseoli]SEK02714.1 gluconokinase [Micromonospora phaseoli]
MKILALDLGTSSVRGLVLDGDARPVPGALARRGVVVTVDEQGAGTLDARHYLACLAECLDELHGQGWLDGVELVATSAQWHSVVPLGPDGEPLGPVLTWLDTRAEPPATATGPADPHAFHQRTGTWWHRCYWSVRLPWLRAQTGSRVARFAGLVEYVLARLLIEAPMSMSQASGTGLLDLRTLDWDAEACALAEIRGSDLPELAPRDWQGRLSAECARRWPALAQARWVPPLGDGAASNVGSGCVDPSRAAVTVGTSSAVRLLQRMPAYTDLTVLPHQLWRYRVDHDHVVTGAAYSSGGNLFAWAERELRLPTGAALDEALALLPPGGGRPASIRFGGDRPPGSDPAGLGELRGLGFGTTAVEMLAGLMRGVCEQVVDDLTVLESTVDQPVEVVLGGGAMAASPWWRETFATVLAPRQVRFGRHPEIGATGAALVAVGRIADAVVVADIGRTDDQASTTTT